MGEINGRYAKNRVRTTGFRYRLPCIMVYYVILNNNIIPYDINKNKCTHNHT